MSLFDRITPYAERYLDFLERNFNKLFVFVMVTWILIVFGLMFTYGYVAWRVIEALSHKVS